uniref:Peptidase_M13_N domain-containing protein n=1 Tax=Steinernema glaseri TaxID=37863 RepID=A0A1I7YVJ3_9BILA
MLGIFCGLVVVVLVVVVVVVVVVEDVVVVVEVDEDDDNFGAMVTSTELVRILIVVDKMAPNKSAETPQTKEIIVIIAVIAVAIVCVAVVGVKSWASYTSCTSDFEDTSKPCDTNAYLDKAFSFHDRYLSYFNYDLRRFLFWQHMPRIPRTVVSNRVNCRVSRAKNLQKKLAESDDENYLKDLALAQVMLAQNQKKSLNETMPAIERYIKALNMDRVYSLEKFLVDFIAFPMKDAVAILHDSLVQSDLKVANLKNLTYAEYHEPIDAYWSELKHNTTPGISGSCLPVNATAEDIMELYTMMIDKRVDKCVPEGEQPIYPVIIAQLIFESLFEWVLLMIAVVVVPPIILLLILCLVGCLATSCDVKRGPIATFNANASTAAATKQTRSLC